MSTMKPPPDRSWVEDAPSFAQVTQDGRFTWQIVVTIGAGSYSLATLGPRWWVEWKARRMLASALRREQWRREALRIDPA